MGKINVLGFDVANLIAAGEVVDRPASVVKELLENAIDAGSRNITVEIQHGGTSLIRVTDNGCGMTPEDLPVAILRHATSKITSANDLDSIMTLGFRGEALAATAAVSKLRILTKTKEAAMGSMLESEGGANVVISESGCANGTTVMVEDLFFNVPARRKFLKKDMTETAAVSSLVEKIALSVPNIAIKYIADGEIKFLTSGNGKLESAIYSIYGREVAKRLVPVDRTERDLRVYGFVSQADFVRPNRNMEHFFINGRFVKSHTAMAALEQAYLSKMQADKFPFCVLNLELNPHSVDVNVHPSKLEVKFSNERMIFDGVYYAVLGALEQNTSRPELSFEGRTTPEIKPEIHIFKEKEPIDKKTENVFVTGDAAKKLFSSFIPVDENRNERANAIRDQIPLEHLPPQIKKETVPATLNGLEIPINEREAIPDEKKEDILKQRASSSQTSCSKDEDILAVPNPPKIPPYIILGEAYNCYVILQLEDKLLLVDKHAAHERILFDKLCENRRKRENASQILMFPIDLFLTPQETDALISFKEDVESLGFAFHVKDDKISVNEIPDDLSREQAQEMIITFAGRLAEGCGQTESMRVEFFEHALWQSACKAAIKGGRIYGEEHIRWICDRLLALPDQGLTVVKTCPHGRPVAFEIKKSSLERQFARLK